MANRIGLAFVLFVVLGPAADAGASSSIEIRARIDGEVERVLVKEGALVKKGEILFELDARLQQARIATAEAQVQLAAASLQRCANHLKRTEELRKTNPAFISKAEYEEAVSKEAEAIAQVNAARANLELAKVIASQTRVVAPIDGKITLLKVTAGQNVKANDLVVKIGSSISVQEPDKVKELLKERHAVLTQVAELQMAAYKMGRTPLSDVFPAQRAVIESGLELCEIQAERIVLLRKGVVIAEEMAKQAEARNKAGVGSQTEALQARAQVLEARIRLLREEAKAK